MNAALLYEAFQFTQDVMAPVRGIARAGVEAIHAWGELGEADWPRRAAALLDLIAETQLHPHRPEFAIGEVMSGNRMVPVTEEVRLSLPFADLLHFAKETPVPKPKMLVVAPLSGHFATLLRDTVRVLSRDHDVYITDWKSARDVPLSAGRFGFDDYTAYVIRFLEELGPGTNMLAVCQPCVQALAATAILAEDDHPCQPRTLTLMGGPVDPRISPTTVNELATQHPLEWFRDNLITVVPWRHPGGGREVYPGFLQLSAFMAMNMGRHVDQHRALYQARADGDEAAAAKIRSFYDEYFAVLDLTAEFYLETIDKVFQQALLAKGELTFHGEPVRPSKIRKTALLTVEGERDDICGVGQTSAAHDLCSSLRPHLKRHHLQPGAGHYGVFSGHKWERQVYPQVRNLVLAMS